MAVDLKALKNHLGANPDYAFTVRIREQAKRMGFKAPKLPNKYVLHIGAKQRNRSSAQSVSTNINQE